jgi:hypothetical protein
MHQQQELVHRGRNQGCDVGIPEQEYQKIRGERNIQVVAEGTERNPLHESQHTDENRWKRALSTYFI